MTLQEYIQLGSEEQISSLEQYQYDLIKQLLNNSQGDYLLAADQWLSANISQTVVFGGEGNKKNIFRDKLFEEIEKFICGCDDGRYDKEREELGNNADYAKETIISVISAAIGAQLGVAGAFVAPAIVLIFQSLGKIVINAWCEAQKVKRVAEHQPQ